MKHIYSLTCPITNEIRYIGCSANPSQRLYKHIMERNRDKNISKGDWLRLLYDKNMTPILNIIESYEDDDVAYSREASWIEYYKHKGHHLFNKTPREKKLFVKTYKLVWFRLKSVKLIKTIQKQQKIAGMQVESKVDLIHNALTIYANNYQK